MNYLNTQLTAFPAERLSWTQFNLGRPVINLAPTLVSLQGLLPACELNTSQCHSSALAIILQLWSHIMSCNALKHSGRYWVCKLSWARFARISQTKDGEQPVNVTVTASKNRKSKSQDARKTKHIGLSGLLRHDFAPECTQA